MYFCSKKTNHNQNKMKRNIITWLMLLSCITIWAQGVKPLPTLHVEGRWLVDKHGNQVVLHGVMDTPSSYFNGGRWHGTIKGSWTDSQGIHYVYDDYNETGRINCLNYFEKLFAGMEQAKCNVFRLHMDPAWTNNDNITASGFSKNAQNKTIDPNGQEVGGEADISHFSETLYKQWLPTLYLELVKKAMNHGMFVVVRPPGVCPHNLKVGDYYNQYLMLVWDIFSQNEYVKEHAGQISIELANEPVSVKNASNQDDPKALHDFFQPIVDKIRSNGFTGIIWVPGTGWQANYTSYAQYPITGNNIGYAVHDYEGWYGCVDKDLTASDVPTATQRKIEQFHNQVPVVDTNPVIVTEIDWSPNNPGAGHYDEHGKWVEPNYGTWCTGRTSVFGTITKGVYDHFGNISMTLSGTGCLIDIDKLLATNTVSPAFDGLAEACGKACMDWYAEYYNVNWPHADDEAETGDAYTLQKIEADPNDIELMTGAEKLIKLTATYADGHTKDISAIATYNVDDPTVLSITNGVIKALKSGSAKITASYKAPAGDEKQVVINVKVNGFDDWTTLTSATDLNGKTFVIMGAEDNKVFYCPGDQNLAYEDAGSVLLNTNIVGYQFKAENISVAGHSNCYLLRLIKLDGNEYSVWGGWAPGYLNTQEVAKNCCFVLGLNNQNGQDIKNGAVWEIQYVTDKGFTLKNIGTDRYLKDATSPAKHETPAYFNFRVESSTSVIATIQRDIEDGVVYNLQGVKVGTRSELRSLPRGIYIIGGKKVVVR